MQVNGSRVLTYPDFVKGLDPKGKFLDRCINLATRANEMLDDITVVEANNGSALETTFRTEVPKPVWTQYYSGIPSNKGSKAKLKVSCGQMGTKITIAKRLYDKALSKGRGYADALLADEVSAAQEGMKLEMGNALIYGLLSDNPLGFNGLFKHYDRYGGDDTDDRNSAHYVLNALGVAGGANAASETKLGSIALVGWDPNSITCFHAENHQSGGIEVTEKKEMQVVDPDMGADATYEAYVQYMYWELGLAVRDFRCGGRICNIQRNDMMDHADGEKASDAAGRYVELIDRLAQRVHEKGRQAWYMDKLVWENVSVLYSRITRQNAITFTHVEGHKERRLYGIPVRIQDCMKVHEEKVLQVA